MLTKRQQRTPAEAAPLYRPIGGLMEVLLASVGVGPAGSKADQPLAVYSARRETGSTALRSRIASASATRSSATRTVTSVPPRRTPSTKTSACSALAPAPT